MPEIPKIKDARLTRAPFDALSSDKTWNETVDQIEQLGLSLANVIAPGNGAARVFEYFLAIITDPPSGQSAYTDGRYWVRRSIPDFLKNSTDQLSVVNDPLASGAQYQQYQTATNLGELSSGTHELLNNTIVLVFAYPDGSSARKTYFFSQQPHRPVFVHLSVNSGSNGSVSGTTITNATYQYDLLSPETGNPIPGATTALTPAGTREQGPLVGPAGIGLARLSADGTTWTLIWCDERRALIACP